MTVPPDQGLEIVIDARDVCKSYKLFRSRSERVLDALGGGRWFYRENPPPTYDALKDLNLRIAGGERVGVVGRNGAGKSTVLKLIGGVIAPTSGFLQISGNAQILMQIGLGFHPDFTGRENIRASLLYSGLTPAQRPDAEAEIIEFVDLARFLDQPLRTYSMGMRSRLQFACATIVRPEVLIIDEVLAVGDSHFIGKCQERIQQLAVDGCTLLLASHSIPQILQFCERAIWIDDGRLRLDGDAATVTAAYQDFMKSLESG
jgi:lipopolysaccharide transport system ATP-binding protein